MLRRILDLAAIAVIVAVAWRLLAVPRFLGGSAPAPHVGYATLSGKPFVLTNDRGRIVFLEFWASWCEPCKAALPIAESFAQSHPEVDVIPIDVGEPREIVAEFAQRHHLRRVALDPRSLSSGFFQIDGFPTMVVIDPKGRIRATWAGFNPALGLNMAHAVKSIAARS